MMEHMHIPKDKKGMKLKLKILFFYCAFKLFIVYSFSLFSNNAYTWKRDHSDQTRLRTCLLLTCTRYGACKTKPKSLKKLFLNIFLRWFLHYWTYKTTHKSLRLSLTLCSTIALE